MSDLISRSALIEYLEKVTVTEGITFETGFKQILTDIKNQPTVEAKPVVHVEWKRVEGTCFKTMKCSECMKTVFEPYNFCPECGADMRGKNDGRT